MEAIEKRFGGNKETNKVQKTLFKQQYENFSGQSSESLDQIHDRLQKLISQLEILGESLSQEDINLKFLRSLPTEWRSHTLIWRNKVDLEDQCLDDLFNNLKIYEAEVKSSSSTSHNTQNIAFVSSQNIDSTNESVSAVPSVSAASIKAPASILSNMDNLSNAVIYYFFASQSNSPQLGNEDLKQIDADDLEEMDLNFQADEEPTNYALMAFTSSSSSSPLGSDSEVAPCSKACTKAYATLQSHYDKLTVDFRKSQFDVLSYKSGLKSVEARLVVYQQNENVFEKDIKLLKLDVMLRDNAPTSSKNLSKLLESQITDKIGLEYDNQVFNSTVFDCDELNSSESDESVPTSLIHDRYKLGEGYHAVPPPYTGTFMPPTPGLVFYDASTASETVPNVLNVEPRTTKPTKKMSQSNRPSALIIEDWVSDSKDEYEGNPQQTLKDKDVIDSGCSRHMTGNISYLSDFEEINGGYVAFGGNPKGGKLTGKGKIRTGKLDFDDVYFVKELKFNLFSVSHMCDKKNSVLFTDTECVVLSFDFKFPDENHVLLRVPRENNMYNVDLKNVVPSGDLTCLFAKATLDESNLWLRRLGHINFKTMNKLVKGNLVRGLPSKVFENNHTCVACKKGKQHRASCKSKPVSSVSHPLQRLHMDLCELMDNI
nr:putative ribonuclease H-like domain-containing protein [Tanacetum cinerariifolium]